MTNVSRASDSGDRARDRGPRFALVQALRGIAAFWVVLFHARAGGHIDHLAAALPRGVDKLIFLWGDAGVPIFFALSGFVIAHSLRDIALSWGFLGRFALRRSIRLDPMYWASILMAVGVAALAAPLRGKPMPLVTPGRILAHIAYLQEFLGLRELNTVYWTLTYEVQFYLFFAVSLTLAAALGAATGRGFQPVLWAGFLLIALVSLTGVFDHDQRGLFLPLWSDFFVGALAYLAASKRKLRPVLVFLIIAMIVRALHDGNGFTAVSGLTAGLLAWSLARGFIETALGWVWLQRLGAISYSLYLTHNPVTAATGFLAARLLPADTRGDLGALAMISIASLAVATLCWWLIEQPSHRLSRRVPLGANL